MPGLTLVERIATRYAVGLPAGRPARSGDFVTIRPAHVMTHDNTGAVIPKFREIVKGAATRLADPRQPVFAIDHDIQNVTPENLGKYAKIEAFAREHGVDFYPAGTGISHQVMVEQGYVRPGSMVVGSDSHSNLYGALACLGTPVVRTDAACLWATGRTWWQVPPVARVELRGRLAPGVSGKDVIIALCGLFNHDEVLNHAVEFASAPGAGPGDGVGCLTMDQRMSIANMTTEWGALAGIFPFDGVCREWLAARAATFDAERAAASGPGSRGPGSAPYTGADVSSWWTRRDEISADADAPYAAELWLDLASIVPHVCGPNDVKTMTPLPEIEPRRVAIQKAWLMSCVNARYEDLALAASIVRGRRVAPGVEFYLAAASAEVQARAVAEGHWGTLVGAGAIELPPGCGTCIGLGRGTIRAGEVGISATNRNFEGRMGDRAGLVYLGSPAVVAASAVAGYICSPTRFDAARPSGGVGPQAGSAREKTRPAASGAPIIDGFPAEIRGRLLWLDKDNLNTDGIYAGKHTYNDSLTKDQMAGLIFENYDPGLRGLARAGDAIAGGLNFGTGSSREQAATALKAFGIPCVIAASFSETYKRNAFNNGFVCFECPALIDHLRRPTAEPRARTVVAGDLAIDFRAGRVELTPPGGPAASFAFAPLSTVAQELVVAGGAEALARRWLAG